MLQALLAHTSSLNCCRRDTVFDGTESLSPPSSSSSAWVHSPKVSSPFVFSLVRSGKADAMKAAYTKYEDRIDIALVHDLINGDFTEALKGVHAVIHVASALPGRQDLQATIDVSAPHSHRTISNRIILTDPLSHCPHSLRYPYRSLSEERSTSFDKLMPRESVASHTLLR